MLDPFPLNFVSRWYHLALKERRILCERRKCFRWFVCSRNGHLRYFRIVNEIPNYLTLSKENASHLYSGFFLHSVSRPSRALSISLRFSHAFSLFLISCILSTVFGYFTCSPPLSLPKFSHNSGTIERKIGSSE